MSVSHVVTNVQGMYVKPNWTVARCIGGLLQVRMVAVTMFRAIGPRALAVPSYCQLCARFGVVSVTCCRVLDALCFAVQWLWLRRSRESHDRLMIQAASGFVLGEGILSAFTAGLVAAGLGP